MSLGYLWMEEGRGGGRRNLTPTTSSFTFALGSSPLAILSLRSTIDWKYERTEDREYSRNVAIESRSQHSITQAFPTLFSVTQAAYSRRPCLWILVKKDHTTTQTPNYSKSSDLYFNFIMLGAFQHWRLRCPLLHLNGFFCWLKTTELPRNKVLKSTFFPASVSCKCRRIASCCDKNSAQKFICVFARHQAGPI